MWLTTSGLAEGVIVIGQDANANVSGMGHYVVRHGKLVELDTSLTFFTSDEGLLSLLHLAGSSAAAYGR